MEELSCALRALPSCAKKAGSKNRFSALGITAEGGEPDPLNECFGAFYFGLKGCGKLAQRHLADGMLRA